MSGSIFPLVRLNFFHTKFTLTDDIVKQRTPPEQRRLIYYNAYFESRERPRWSLSSMTFSSLLSGGVASVYTDRAHYSDHGATIVAEAVVDRIKPLIEKKLYQKPRTVDTRQL